MSYKYLFYKNLMFRKSCGNCHYTNTNRPSDITLADFWGWEKTNTEINKDNKGVSLIFCNTEKGKKLFDLIKKDLDYFPALLENCIQPNLQHPTPISPKAKKFEQEYKEKGFKYVYFKYGEEGWRYKVKTRTVSLVKMPFRALKKIYHILRNKL